MTSLNLGTQTQTPAFGYSFGATTSTTATPSFAATSFTNPTTSVSSTGLAFGATSTTGSASLFGSSTGFSVPSTTSSLFPTAGQVATTTASTGFTFGGFGTTGTSTGINFGSTTAVATTSASTVGLGGVDLQASSINGVNTSATKDKAVKESFLPHELVATLDAFKKHIKEQKTIREEMSRITSKGILKVQSQVGALRQQLTCVSNGLQRNALAIAKLKLESSEELSNAKIIQRTKDTPPSLQYENTAPAAYFHNLAISFENQMQLYRQQIEQLERHLLSLSQPSAMTPNELTTVMRRLHDAFVTLAAQLQTVHQKVQAQKELFLSLIKVSNGDMSNIFHSRKATTDEVMLRNGHSALSVNLGPMPLMLGSSPSAIAAISNLRNQNRSLQNGNASLIGTNTTALGSNLSNSSFLGSSQLGFGSGFGGSGTSSFKPLGK